MNIHLNASHRKNLEMLARNPKTGTPIRILRSEASVSRKKKTLVWLQDQEASIPWERWETVCVGQEDIQKWEQKKKTLDFLVLLESDETAVEYFLSLDFSKYKMMFVTKALVMSVGWQKFKSLQLFNVIVLEEVHLMYPFLGQEWKKTKEDAVLIVAASLRMSRIVGFVDGFTSDRQTYLQGQDMSIQFVKETPMPLWFITQFYKPDKTRREKEIKKCLEENVKCSLIDKVVLLNEKDFSDEFPKTEKIEQHIVGKRLTYRMIVEWVLQHVPDNVLVVFGNADIYLDDSWKDTWSVEMEDIFFALLRWDVQEGKEPSKIFGPRNDSQDTWAFLSHCVKSKQWDFAALDFPFGKAGCDNAITVEMLRKKFLIVNPAMSIKTHHLQLTNYRTYDPKEIVDKPTYMYVDPTGIHDMEPIFDLRPYMFDKLEFSSFERRLSSSKPKSLDIYCKMLERGERYIWKPNATNVYPTESVQLYNYKNAFQTPQGLAYGYSKIFVGKEEVSKVAWSKSELSPIHPAYDSERCFAVPWSEEFTKVPESYIVKFLPKILMMKEKYGSGEFFAPEKGCVPYLECFAWEEKTVPLLSHRPNAQIWCKELIQYPLTEKQEIHKEEIFQLRKCLKTRWQEKASASKIAVMIDGKYVTNQMVSKWEETHPEYEWAVMYEGRTSPDRMIEKLLGASAFLFAGGANSISRWGMAWCLPLGIPFLEIQNEMDLDGEAAHMAAASSLSYQLLMIPRSSESTMQEMILSEVSQAIKNLSTFKQEQSLKPTVYMPRRSLEGFFGHAGDSFREMVELWAEKQYVDAVEDSRAVQVWLGGVGETLLYDRPTMDWLDAAPAEEQKWKFALFGNPKPSESGGPASSWFFWPRRPRLVEALVEQGLPKKTWKEREHFLVFYGKIENAVQEKRRLDYDWSSVCDEYAMVKGEKTTYKYTQRGYLEQLAKAKFGLCLAGFGKKCHREVECMAMGCVPVCSSNVDMSYYAVPPVEGIHYIRVEKPEDVETKVKSISEEKWEIMSAACKSWWVENASAQGSWNLTQTLQKLKATA